MAVLFLYFFCSTSKAKPLMCMSTRFERKAMIGLLGSTVGGILFLVLIAYCILHVEVFGLWAK